MCLNAQHRAVQGREQSADWKMEWAVTDLQGGWDRGLARNGWSRIRKAGGEESGAGQRFGGFGTRSAHG